MERDTADAHAALARESTASGKMAKRWNQSAENSKREDPTDIIVIISSHDDDDDDDDE